jgi:uncharacterized membrane protein YdbT with pleckstrin-like domain
MKSKEKAYIITPMTAISSFTKDPVKTTYDGKDNDEQILYVVRRSVITLIPTIFVIVLFLILPFVIDPFLFSIKVGGAVVFNAGFIFIATLFWYLVVLGFMFQVFINWFFNAYIISDRKLIDLDFIGLLYKNVSETTLDHIEDVTSTVAGVFGTVFNIGSVFIQTAGEKNEFDVSQIDDPSKVRDIITDLASERQPDVHSK